jgi:hypothetical protein
MLAQTAVHTVGINWSSVLTIICSVVGAMAVIFAFIARLVTSAVTNSIDKFRIEVIAKMEVRLSILEQIVLRKYDGDTTRLRFC